jgi:hypothetical protein
MSLRRRWTQQTAAVIIPVTGGNFRLLNRLLTQVQRILEINTLEEVTKARWWRRRQGEPRDRTGLMLATTVHPIAIV